MNLRTTKFWKRFTVCLIAAMLLAGNLSVAIRVQAGEKTEVQLLEKTFKNNVAVQGDLLDQSGKPSGVKWDFDAASGKLTISGKGVPCGFKSEFDGGPVAPWYTYKENIKKIEINSGVEPESMAYWFYGCKNLEESPELPDSVKNMECTFYGCEKLENAPEFPVHLENADGMFRFCTNLKITHKIPASAKKLSALYYNCENLELPKDFQLPKGVEDLQLMFTGCYKLRHLPDGFRIPDHVKYLDGMFWNCIGLKYVPDLPGDAASAEWMFAGCALENLPDDFQLPKGIKNVNGLFIGNDLLKKLPNTFTIPDGVEDAAEMFSGCDSLTKLPKGFHIPASVKKTDNMFKVASGSQKMLLPYKNESLKKYAGWGADGRTVIQYCTVEFKDVNGIEIESVDVNCGESIQTVQIPKAPKGCHWEIPDSLTTISGDISIMAKKEEYTVKFQDWDGRRIDEQKVKCEEAAKEPKAPVRPGYTFTGWDKSFDKITRDITVTAVYKKNPEKTDPIPHVPGVKRPKKKLPLTKAVKSGRLIKVRWKKKKGAKGYVIYYSTKKKGKYKKIAAVGKGLNTKVILKSGKKYYFKARPYTKTKKGKKKYKKYIKARKKELNKAVQVTYKNVSGYEKYEIWMKVGKKKYKKVKSFYHGGTLIYTKQKAKTGKKYKFLLKASDIKNGSNARVIK